MRSRRTWLNIAAAAPIALIASLDTMAIMQNKCQKIVHLQI